MPRQHEEADTKTLNKYGDREGGTGGFYTGRFLLKDYSTDLALQSSNIVKLTLLVSKLMQQNQGYRILNYFVFLVKTWHLHYPQSTQPPTVRSETWVCNPSSGSGKLTF